MCHKKIAIDQSESFYGYLFRLSDPLIEPRYMYAKSGLFSLVSFPESLSTEKRQLFKVEADLRDKITNLFNGIYISICLACFKWFEKKSQKNCFRTQTETLFYWHL